MAGGLMHTQCRTLRSQFGLVLCWSRRVGAPGVTAAAQQRGLQHPPGDSLHPPCHQSTGFSSDRAPLAVM